MNQVLEQEFNTTDYRIVHLATHGQFDSDRKETFKSLSALMIEHQRVERLAD